MNKIYVVGVEISSNTEETTIIKCVTQDAKQAVRIYRENMVEDYESGDANSYESRYSWLIETELGSEVDVVRKSGERDYLDSEMLAARLGEQQPSCGVITVYKIQPSVGDGYIFLLYCFFFSSFAF